MKHIFTTFTIAFTLTNSAVAYDKTEATRVISTHQAKLQDSATTHEQETRIIERLFAYDVIAERSLGAEWNGLNAEQRKEFTTIMSKMIKTSFLKNNKKLINYNVEYVDEFSEGSAYTVSTLAKHKTKKSEPALKIEFTLETVDNQLKIVDIFTEDSSMVKTYRSQFIKLLKRDGYQRLIEKMNKKLK